MLSLADARERKTSSRSRSVGGEKTRTKAEQSKRDILNDTHDTVSRRNLGANTSGEITHQAQTSLAKSARLYIFYESIREF